jgi:hypothetical protein
MWKDQQTDIGKDPHKLTDDLEKAAIKATSGEALENVGDSTNEKGGEIPKRNLTTDEQDEVNLYRKGLGDLVYDNEPSEEYEKRMKADMGDDLYKQRQDKLAFGAKAPMYNKDTQPMEDGIDKSQFDKQKSGWAVRDGIDESMISGRYRNALDKSKIIDFELNEVKMVVKMDESLFKLDFTGLGNSLKGRTVDNKVNINESVVNALGTHVFYTDTNNVFAMKNPVVSLQENDEKGNEVINEEKTKLMHLLGYKPNNFVSTKKTKLGRGF